MKNLILTAFTGALLLSTPAFAQMGTAEATGAAAPSKGGTAGKMTPSASMSSDSSTPASDSKPMMAKPHHRHMSMSESKMDASEAETTKQLNMEQAQNQTQNSMGAGQGMSGGPGMNGNASDRMSGIGSNHNMNGDQATPGAPMGENKGGSNKPAAQ